MADDGIKRTTIRFSYVKKEHHRKACDIMATKANSAGNEFIIQAIIEKEERADLFAELRRIVREELARIPSLPSPTQVSVVTQQPTAKEPSQASGDIPDEAMDFMKKLG